MQKLTQNRSIPIIVHLHSYPLHTRSCYLSDPKPAPTSIQDTSLFLTRASSPKRPPIPIYPSSVPALLLSLTSNPLLSGQCYLQATHPIHPPFCSYSWGYISAKLLPRSQLALSLQPWLALFLGSDSLYLLLLALNYY